MKKIIFLFLFLLSVSKIYSQPGWSPSYKLTSGFNDDNPSFTTTGTPFSLNTKDICVFERTVGGIIQICAIKFNPASPDTTVTYITSSSNSKLHPVIAQNPYPNATIGDNINSMAIWQEYRSGKWDLMGATFKNVSGWSLPFIIDESAGNKTNPSVAVRTMNDFKIAYERGPDIFTTNIFFMSFNALSLTVINNIQVTNTPSVSFYYPLIEANNSSAFNLVYSSSTGGLYTNSVSSTSFGVSATKTIETSGAWKATNLRLSFEGTMALYSAGGVIKSVNIASSSPTPSIYTSQPVYSFYSPYFYIFPIITESFGSHSSQVLSSMFFAFNQTFNMARKVILITGTIKDTINIGDSSSSKIMTMSNGMAENPYIRVYSVYSKDSAGQRNLYYVYGRQYNTDIHNNESFVGDYSLTQNYPNPFNPTTNIEFSISKAASISLVVYDVSGKEVDRIYNNESLSSGSYHNTFSRNDLCSGVYFYSLFADGVKVETKRMVLLK